MTATNPGTTQELQVLHWNIHSWRDDTGVSNLEAVAELVRTIDPHVVSLVEVDESWASPSTLDKLASHSEYASVFIPSFEFGKENSVGGFGNALLSKLPILAVRQRQLTWPPRLYRGSEPSEPRSVIFARLQATAVPVWVGSTHLPRSDQQARAAALQRLITIVQDLGDPWLLLGDFNTAASSWLTEQLSLQAHPLAQPTYPTKAPTEPIDYCLAPQALSIHAEVLSVAGSDHLPLLVRCRLEHGQTNRNA